MARPWRWLLVGYLSLQLGGVWAAPHLDGSAEPPVAKRGVPFTERYATASKGPTLLGKLKSPISTYPATVRAIFIRVDFPAPSAGDAVTGSGSWSDALYAYDDGSGPNADYWIQKNATDLIHYYNEVSYGQLSLEVTVSSSVYRLPYSTAWYGAETNSSIENLIHDAVTIADPDINYSQYDAVFIVHAGPGQETDTGRNTPDDIWSLYYTDDRITPSDVDSQPPLVTDDGVEIREAVIMPQTGTQDGLTVDPLGIYAHEFGHWLGLPDLYATGYLLFPSWDGIGQWGLMGSGLYGRATASEAPGSSPSHFNAWSRVYLGWLTPLEVSSATAGEHSLRPVETTKDVLKLHFHPENRERYFLLENRQKLGFDASLPGSGVLVWEVDDSIIRNSLPQNRVNSYSTQAGVKLVEADGDDALKNYGGDNGSSGDPFPGAALNTQLTPWTFPGTQVETGTGWLYVEGISEAVDSTVFTVGFAPMPPQSLVWEGLTQQLSVLSWGATPGDDVNYYKVYKNGNYAGRAGNTSFTVKGDGYNDVFQVSAVNSAGYESVLSSEAQAVSGSEDTRCFIATAAHGSPYDPQVKTLRAFRDRFLLSHAPGRWLVSLYYRSSPPIADWVAQSEIARWVVRSLLTPIVGLAQLLLLPGGWLLLLAGGMLVYWWRRESGRRLTAARWH